MKEVSLRTVRFDPTGQMLVPRLLDNTARVWTPFNSRTALFNSKTVLFEFNHQHQKFKVSGERHEIGSVALARSGGPDRLH